MLTGKRRHCHNEANECTYRFENVKGLRVDLIFRVYNDGIAFRYHLPKTKEEIVVLDEYTAFAFTPGIKRWTQKFTVGYEGFIGQIRTALQIMRDVSGVFQHCSNLRTALLYY